MLMDCSMPNSTHQILDPNDQLNSWLLENYEHGGEDDTILKSSVFDSYNNQFPDNPFSKPTIGKTIHLIFPGIGTKRKGKGKGNSTYHYTGLKERTRYCLCRSTNVEGFMIQCSLCEEWLHGSCVNILEEEGNEINEYACPICVEEFIQNGIVQDMQVPQLHKCDECSLHFPTAVGLSHHIRHKHHDWYRRILAGTQLSEVKKQIKEPPKTTSSEPLKSELKLLSKKLDSILKSSDLDMNEFDVIYKELVTLFIVANDSLPGPKHPATKFYNIRKKRHLFKQCEASHKSSSNPQRTSKRARARRKEKYNYELMQYLFYNKRKACVRKLIDKDEVKCRIPMNILHESLSSKWGQINPSCRLKYEDQPSQYDQSQLDTQYSTTISSEEVQSSLQSMNNDSSPGPDNIKVRVLKHLEAWDCLAKVFTIFHKWNFLPKELKEAYTILVYKSGLVEDPGNWRPISICSCIRRLYEKVILKRMRQYVTVSQFQTGSQNTPGTFINTSIINGCLQKAKEEQLDLTVILLDVSKAFDCIGHAHIIKTLNCLPFPTDLKNIITELVEGNVTRIKNGGDSSQLIKFERGIFQGSVISPEIFNLSIDFIIRSLSEDEVARKFGFKVNEDLKPLSVAGFMDDTSLIANNLDSAYELSHMAKDLFHEIGLELNVNKTQAICIKNGKLSTEDIMFANDVKIKALKEEDTIKYLGVNFNDEIVFDPKKVLLTLQESISTLASTPMLHPDQKIQIINQYIWPKIIYPLQSAPTSKIPNSFLEAVDKMMRSCVREILQLPQDAPNAMFYTSSSNKGLHLFSAAWEAHIQNHSICNRLKFSNNDYVNELRDLSTEMQVAIEHLEISNEEYHNLIKKCKTGLSINKKIREHLRTVEFTKWKNLKFHGKGVETFDICPSINRVFFNKTGLSSSEWTSYWKMISNTVPVRVLHGRSQGSVRCRRCNENVETLGHVLGFCPYGELLRNERHHRIRSMIADKLRNMNYEVYEEVPTLDRRIDIIAIDRVDKTAFVLDPTIRMETSCQQAIEVDTEKKSIYEPCTEDLRIKFDIPQEYSFEVIGLLVGARGTISTYFSEFFGKLKIPKQFLMDIAISAVKGSCRILHNHLYSPISQ